MILRSAIAMFACMAAAACAFAGSSTMPAEADSGPFGYTRPLRSSELAATEPEAVAEILVKEGQAVTKGQVLARLDCAVLEATLRQAQAEAKCEGRINAAKAELDVQSMRLKRLASVQDQGNVRPEELDRVKADVEIAKSNLQAATEARTLKELEVKKIEAQIEHRTIRGPFDGVVSEIFREVGETPQAPGGKIMTIVQLDKLKASIHLDEPQARKLAAGRNVSLEIGPDRRPVTGKVAMISPVISPASNTVKVEFEIDNASGELKSGSQVRLADTPAAVSGEATHPARQ